MSSFTQIIGSILLACLPVMLWGYIFIKKNPESKRLTGITFLAGALAVFPILLYKYSWQYLPWLNAFKIAEPFREDIIGISTFISIPLSVIITFMLVGVIEEIMKMFSVKIIDDGKFHSIDDAIEFFIVGALGFSFTENILYFYSIWQGSGIENLFFPFLFRSSFSTFAHLMFSGILGYYYGIAYFATSVLQEEIKAKRNLWTIYLHKIFNVRKEKLFHQEKLLEGLLIATGLHAIFNIFLELNITYLIVPFLVSGYLTLNYLLTKKENHKKYGRLLEL